MNGQATPSARAELRHELGRAVAGYVRFDAYTRAMYSTDASIYQMYPVGVVAPRSADDVQAVIEICGRRGVWVLPRGGGTALAGQSVNHAIVIDFTRYMHAVREVNPEERWVRAEPGITLDELNRRLRPHGLMFTPDPSTSSRATVGGAMGNNSCGAHSIVYGKTVDHVLEMDVVLADGSRSRFQRLAGAALESKLAEGGLEGAIYRGVRQVSARSKDEVERRFPKIMRRVGGYNLDRTANPGEMDLTQIMVGSEGTLACATAAKLNLEPIPKHRGLAVVHFSGLIEAMEATVATLEESPAAVEHIGSLIIRQARQALGLARALDFLQGEPEDLLVVEFTGDTEKEVVGKLDRLESRLRRGRLGYATTRLLKPAEQARVWAMRKAGQGLLMAVEGPAKSLPFVEDTAVAPEKLPEYVRRFDEILKRHGATAGYYGHASVGCLHIRPFVNLKERAGIEQLASIAADVSDLVLEFNGALSGEHGDGIVRGVWAEKVFGPRLTQAFREIKKTFDPDGIMNPGKVFDTPGLTDNLRYGEAYRPPPVATRLDFSQEGGLAAAAEKCSGLGQCRKLNAGVMCPSYMATREEEHSTRGRANALRFALSGQLAPDAMQSERMFKVLDLCLECKACKAECPARVDMAKIKYEFLHSYYRRRRLPLRSRLVADIHRLDALAAPVAPVANLLARSAPTRWALEKTVGLHRDRPLPRVVRNTFEKRFVGRGARSNAPRGQAVLFHDTFTNFNHPAVGIAAVRLLEAMGYEVVILRDRRCCGRPMISKGMLDRAADNAAHNIDLLYPYAARGTPIVGCESSCVMAIKDDYPDLLGRDDQRVTAVAEAVRMVEDVIADSRGDDGPQIEFSGLKKSIAFFGHCHQRALTGTNAALSALRMPPGYEVREIEAGCCGMAGAFGYEKEHVGISLACGEDRLFPVIRALPPETEIAITGVSCRDQIAYGTGRSARHLVEVLADALPG